MPLKVLMIDRNLYPYGGAQTYMLAIAEELQRRGHSVAFFGMANEKNVVGNSAGLAVSYVDFRGKGLKKYAYPLKLLYSVEARKKLRVVLRQFRPDIVHLHGFNFHLTPSILYEIKKHGIPMVATVHDAQIACPSHRLYVEHTGRPCTDCVTGKFYRCVANRCLSNSLARSALAAMESYLYHGLRTYGLIDRFILPSRFMYDILIKAGIDAGKMRVMLNFSRMKSGDSPMGEASRGNYVLYFGRLSKEKGIQTLAAVCRLLPDVHFIIAGAGELSDVFADLANVETLGYIAGLALQTLIQNAVVTVYPSEWHENCPMSVLESQALGTPVIGANIGGIPELIDDGHTGLLFESGNVYALKEKIEMVYYHPDVQQNMRSNCIKRKDLMNPAQYVDALLEQYALVMPNGR